MARKYVTFTGATAAGTISVSGVKVGDRVLAAIFATGVSGVGINVAGSFSTLIDTDDQVIQTENADLSSRTITMILDRDLLV